MKTAILSNQLSLDIKKYFIKIYKENRESSFLLNISFSNIEQHCTQDKYKKTPGGYLKTNENLCKCIVISLQLTQKKKKKSE